MIENYKTSRELVDVFLRKLEEMNRSKKESKTIPSFSTQPRL